MLVCEESLKPSSSDVAETADLMRFNTSLQELRDIRSQLHYAADYCESTFLDSHSKDKKEVVENTKEYICRAIVTMVDHLGNVSSNLTTQLSHHASSSFPHSQRLDSLQQRIMSCGRLGSEFAMTKLRWSAAIPRYHSRYLMSTTNAKSSSDQAISILRLDSMGAASPQLFTNRAFDSSNSSVEQDDKPGLGKEEGLPLFMYTFPMKKPSVPNSSNPGYLHSTTIVPVRDGPTILSKVPNSTFQFQGGGHYKKQRKGGVVRKSGHGSEVLALIRRRVRRIS